MPNSIRHDIPVQEFGVKVYIRTLAPITVTVECDETQIADRVREYEDDIIADAIEQIKSQLQRSELGNGMVVVDKRPAGWDK